MAYLHFCFFSGTVITSVHSKVTCLLATQGGFTNEIIVIAVGGINDETVGFAFPIPSNKSVVIF